MDTTMSPSPMPAASRAARETTLTARPSSPRPTLCATSVWVAMPRNANAQKMAEKAMVPTPRAATGSEPGMRATKAVSARPVNGSATREKRTGKAMRISVRLGLSRKGCRWGRCF